MNELPLSFFHSFFKCWIGHNIHKCFSLWRVVCISLPLNNIITYGIVLQRWIKTCDWHGAPQLAVRLFVQSHQVLLESRAPPAGRSFARCVGDRGTRQGPAPKHHLVLLASLSIRISSSAVPCARSPSRRTRVAPKWCARGASMSSAGTASLHLT